MDGGNVNLTSEFADRNCLAIALACKLLKDNVISFLEPDLESDLEPETQCESTSES